MMACVVFMNYGLYHSIKKPLRMSAAMTNIVGPEDFLKTQHNIHLKNYPIYLLYA